MCIITDNFTVEQIRDLFDYRDGDLFWKNPKQSRLIGKPVGTRNPKGYLCVGIKKKTCMVHRLVFFIHNEWLPIELDHKDNDPLNNRIDNLRPANRTTNNYNKRIRSDSKTGVKNVQFDITSGKYRVRMRVCGRLKCFGKYKTIEEASEKAKQIRMQLHGSFVNHGETSTLKKEPDHANA